MNEAFKSMWIWTYFLSLQFKFSEIFLFDFQLARKAADTSGFESNFSGIGNGLIDICVERVGDTYILFIFHPVSMMIIEKLN